MACSKVNFIYLLTYLLTPWCTVLFKANWFAASQEIPRISRNPKVHYRTHKVNFTFPKFSSRWFLPALVPVGKAVLAVAEMARLRTAWDLMAEEELQVAEWNDHTARRSGC